MDVDNLIEMANCIGEFFDSMPDHDEEAIDGVADHICRFWKPRMRLAIPAALENPEVSASMEPILREALTKHRENLLPDGHCLIQQRKPCNSPAIARLFLVFVISAFGVAAVGAGLLCAEPHLAVTQQRLHVGRRPPARMRAIFQPRLSAS
ncbi:NAD-dependent formate dehydrogenase delta subunit [Candidatus Paraburkholderia calva]|nr:NAD-dependent formate dehydrogenase delta subunit [Candidatus Paraburkholderia calva]